MRVRNSGSSLCGSGLCGAGLYGVGLYGVCLGGADLGGAGLDGVGSGLCWIVCMVVSTCVCWPCWWWCRPAWCWPCWWCWPDYLTSLNLQDGHELICIFPIVKHQSAQECTPFRAHNCQTEDGWDELVCRLCLWRKGRFKYMKVGANRDQVSARGYS